MELANLLRRLVSAPETRYVQLRFGRPDGYGPNSIVALENYREPLPPSLVWLSQAGAVPCDRPPAGPDGVIDLEQVLRDEALVEAAIQRSQEPEKRHTRAEVRERYGWDDHNVNFSMDIGLLQRPIPQFVKDPEIVGGRVQDVIEHWPASAIRDLDAKIERLFPHSSPKRSR
jgi:hypothetical protein